MKYLLFILFLDIIALPTGKAQEIIKLPEEELLRLLEQSEKDDTVRVDLWNELAYRFRNTKVNEADSMAQKAYSLAARYHYKAGQASSRIVQGLIAKYAAEYDSSEQFFREALTLRQSIGDIEGVASCYNNLGQLFKDQQSNYEKAESYFLKGIEVLAGGQTKMAGTLMNNLGSVLTKMGKYDEAIQYLETSVQIRETQQEEYGLAWSKLNLAIAFQELRGYDKSDKLLMESLSVFEQKNKPDGQSKCYLLIGNNAFYRAEYLDALESYKRALEFASFLDQGDRAIVYRNSGSAYFRLGENEKALDNYLFCRDIFAELENTREVAALDFDIGNIYFGQSLYELALDHFQKSNNQLKSVNDPKLESQLLFYLSATHRHLGHFEEALAFKNRYTQIQDSIYNRAQNALLAERQLEEARKENVQAEKRKLIIYGVFGFLILWLLLTIAVLYAYLNKKKRKLALEKIDKMLDEHDLEIHQARQEIQDEERNRIAQDLHDRVGSMLTTIKLHFATIDSKITKLREENQNQYNKAIHLLDEVCDEVRNISHNLQSGILKNFGLKAELESFIARINDTNQLQAKLVTHGLQERLNNNLERNVSKIIRELAGNVLKHANASELIIQVNHFEEVLNIMVEDNGIGFEPEKIKGKGGIGLKSITSRVHGLEGIINIDSGKGNGTTVLIDIPLSKKL